MSKQCPNCEYYKTEYTLEKRTINSELVFRPLEFALRVIFCTGIFLSGLFVIYLVDNRIFYIFSLITWSSIFALFIKDFFDEKNNPSDKSDFYRVDREREVIGYRYSCNNCGYTWSEESRA